MKRDPGSLDITPPTDKHTTLMILPVTGAAAGLFFPVVSPHIGPAAFNIGTVRVDFNPFESSPRLVER